MKRTIKESSEIVYRCISYITKKKRFNSMDIQLACKKFDVNEKHIRNVLGR